MHKRKMTRHAKFQLLYLQMIMLKVELNVRGTFLVNTARFNYTQPLNNSIYVLRKVGIDTILEWLCAM